MFSPNPARIGDTIARAIPQKGVGLPVDVRSLFDSLHRDPESYPLFARIWDVVTLAPSSRHMGEEELVSLSADALDYLQANGRWYNASTTGRTDLHWDGRSLRVQEDDDRGWTFEKSYEIY